MRAGKILDGRNRYQACMETGVAVRTQEWQGGEEEAVDFVWSKNAERRDLTPGQRAFARLELDSLVQRIKAEAKERQRLSPGPEKVSPRGETFSPPIHTEEQLAKLAGVGSGTMARAGVLKRKADSGNEKAAQLVEEVKAGTMPLTTAYEQVRSSAPTKPAKEKRQRPASSALPAATPTSEPLPTVDEEYAAARRRSRSPLTLVAAPPSEDTGEVSKPVDASRPVRVLGVRGNGEQLLARTSPPTRDARQRHTPPHGT